MAENDQNVIAHLLEVEAQAAEIVSDAQKEADKRIAAARSAADEEFRGKYQTMIAEMEKDCEAKISLSQKKHDDECAAYKEEIKKSSKDSGAFNSMLDKIFFAK